MADQARKPRRGKPSSPCCHLLVASCQCIGAGEIVDLPRVWLEDEKAAGAEFRSMVERCRSAIGRDVSTIDGTPGLVFDSYYSYDVLWLCFAGSAIRTLDAASFYIANATVEDLSPRVRRHDGRTYAPQPSRNDVADALRELIETTEAPWA